MGKQEWIEAVTSGATELSFAEWEAAAKDSKKYITGVGSVKVWVVVDINTNDIVRVVAEDWTLTEANELTDWTYLNQNFESGSAPSAPEITQAIATMNDKRNHWPEWDWSW